MPAVLAHAGHSHGPSVTLIALVVAILVLGIAATAAASRSTSRSMGARGRCESMSPAAFGAVAEQDHVLPTRTGCPGVISEVQQLHRKAQESLGGAPPAVVKDRVHLTAQQQSDA
jgi:hypothetical protein